MNEIKYPIRNNNGLHDDFIHPMINGVISRREPNITDRHGASSRCSCCRICRRKCFKNDTLSCVLERRSTVNVRETQSVFT